MRGPHWVGETPAPAVQEERRADGQRQGGGAASDRGVPEPVRQPPLELLHLRYQETLRQRHTKTR